LWRSSLTVRRKLRLLSRTRMYAVQRSPSLGSCSESPTSITCALRRRGEPVRVQTYGFVSASTSLIASQTSRASARAVFPLRVWADAPAGKAAPIASSDRRTSFFMWSPLS
jgi:hypothetical protein